MNTYTPDQWVILAITPPSGETLYKVFATWCGGYTSGESWKLSSGNEKVVKDIYWWHVHGYSGSIYELHRDGYGMSSYTAGVLNNMLEKAGDVAKLLTEEESLEYLNNASNTQKENV